MKIRLYKSLITFSILTSLIFLYSCEKEKVYPPASTTTGELYSLMNQWYLWKDSIPDVDPDNYDNPGDLLEAMRYTPRDKWSYITTKEEHSQYYNEGTYVGYGFGHDVDLNGNVRITFVFEDSELKDYNIDRGWKINEINGTTVTQNTNINNLLGADEVGVSNDFVFESPTGQIVSESLGKKLITMNTVGYESVIDVSGVKTGYFVFKSFIGPSIDELTDVFNYFKTENIEELVIDLRYNGGGRMDVVAHMAGLIIPDNVNGELFVRYEHNEDRSGQNEDTFFEQDANSLRLNKVYFIAGKNSASASEVIINSLEPYMDVYIVGDDTYGKPVGMYSFESYISDLVYVPISFKLLNADGYGGYYDGLKADSYVADDLENSFGEGEAVLDEVLYHIENGVFSSTKSSIEIPKRTLPELNSIKSERGAI